MKKTILVSILLFFYLFSRSQTDKQKVERACLDYIEAFYEADTTKWIRSVKPSLYKLGFWKSNGSSTFDQQGLMTFKEGLFYINRDRQEKKFAKPDSPKAVEVLNILKVTAVAKVTAYWGWDYILLSKLNGKWMIESVIYETNQ